MISLVTSVLLENFFLNTFLFRVLGVAVVDVDDDDGNDNDDDNDDGVCC